MSSALSHLFVSVRDLRASEAFYVGRLGLEILLGSVESGYLRVGGGGGFHLGLEEHPDDAIATDGIEIVIRVDDVDELCRRLTAAGFGIERGPADQPWGARHAWLRDPTGYRVSVYSAIRPEVG
jgi:catechol 2,3-dioxygenase-like lactoylglutathione lyase family enzyme